MSLDENMPAAAKRERILELAVECNDITPPADPELRQLLLEEIDEWEARIEALDPDDPLHAAAAEELADLRERRQRLLEADPDVYHAFLESVAEQFVLAGFWLDERIFEALNRTLFGKYGEALVVDGHLIEPESQYDDNGNIYELSMTVRETARRMLRHGDR